MLSALPSTDTVPFPQFVGDPSGCAGEIVMWGCSVSRIMCQVYDLDCVLSRNICENRTRARQQGKYVLQAVMRKLGYTEGFWV